MSDISQALFLLALCPGFCGHLLKPGSRFERLPFLLVACACLAFALAIVTDYITVQAPVGPGVALGMQWAALALLMLVLISRLRFQTRGEPTVAG